MPIGVIVNCISVLAGGVIGSALGQVLPNSLKEHIADAVRHVFDRYRHQFHYQGGQHDSGCAGDSGGVYHRAPAAP